MEISPVAAASATEQGATIYVALELSKSRWLVGIHTPLADKVSRYSVPGGDGKALPERIGFTINGLAILNEDPTVDSYYYANVIGGTGASVITANDYEAYGKAIEAKLIKEISGAPIARAPAAPGPALAVRADRHRPPARRPWRPVGAGS